MGTAVPPAAPPRPVRNTTSWSGTAYSSGQAGLISQPALIWGGVGGGGGSFPYPPPGDPPGWGWSPRC